MLWELAIDAAGVGTFDWDLSTGALTWDERLLELFGLRPRGVRRHHRRLQRPAAPRRRGPRRAGPAGGRRHRRRVPRGVPRPAARRRDPLARRARARAGRPGRPGGAPARRRVRRRPAGRSRRPASATCSSRCRPRSTRSTATGASPTSTPRPSGCSGGPARSCSAACCGSCSPRRSASEFETQYRRAVETGRPAVFDAYYPAPLDGWYELRVWPSTYGLSVYFLDVTARRRAQEQAEAAAARTALRDAVTADLTGTLDVEVGRRRAWPGSSCPRSPTGASSAWSTPTSTWTGGGGCATSAAGTSTRDGRDLVERYRELRMSALSESAFIAPAARDGRVAQVRRGAAAAHRRDVDPRRRAGRAHRPRRPTAPSPSRCPARGRTVGLLSLYNGPARGPISALDLQAARDIAGRAGLALDNARLYQEQRAAGRGPAALAAHRPARSPTTPTSSCATSRRPRRRRSAATGTTRSCSPTARRSLVIGDVIGHDTVAAAAMGQVRGLLRGIAADSGAGPADVLRRVDRVMRTLQVDTTATARRGPARADRPRSASAGSPGCAGPTPATRRRSSSPPDGAVVRAARGRGRPAARHRPGRRARRVRGGARARRHGAAATPTGSSSAAGRAWTTGWPGCATR